MSLTQRKILAAALVIMALGLTGCTFNLGSTRTWVRVGTRMPGYMGETQDGKKMVLHPIEPQEGTVLLIVRGQLDAKPAEADPLVEKFKLK